MFRQEPLSEEDTAAWLAWCEGNSKVKVQEYPVPDGILSPGYKATLHDVKVRYRSIQCLLVFSLLDTRPPYMISRYSTGVSST